MSQAMAFIVNLSNGAMKMGVYQATYGQCFWRPAIFAVIIQDTCLEQELGHLRRPSYLRSSLRWTNGLISFSYHWDLQLSI